MAVIEKKKLSEQVVEEIRQRMESGLLNVGDKLPNQKAFARELGVSLTSLREAMNILGLLGVIKQRPGFGTELIHPVPETMPEGLRSTFLADRKAIIRLLEARMIIETGSARLAAREASPEQLLELSGIVRKMKAVFQKKDFEGYALLDQKYHKRIIDFSKNNYIIGAYVSIKQHMSIFIQENVLLRNHLLAASQHHHESIYRAISERDMDKAALAMNVHIQDLLDGFKNYKK